MSNSCRPILKDLVRCIRKTQCVLVEKRDVKDCLVDEAYQGECSMERTVYRRCKLKQLDMRVRLKGNKNVSGASN
eukprot:g65794.t1